MTTVDFGSQQTRTVGQQYVYCKRNWNSTWTWMPQLHCLEATWCLSPSMPTATLVWDYGWVKGLGENFALPIEKLAVNGYYVKVVLQTNTLTDTWNTWWGIVSHVEDEQQGIVTHQSQSKASGRQTLRCYGLEKMLDTESLSESYVDVGDAGPITVQLPITFNHGGQPNMNDRLIAPENGHVFEGQVLTPGGTNRPTAAWWSTWEICDYLIRWMVPKESFRTRKKRVAFELANDAMYLPLHDQPVIEQENETVLGLLNRLIDRRRLRSFYCTVREPGDGSPDVIQLVIVAWNPDEINTGLSGADVYLPNYDSRTLLYDYSQTTATVVRKTLVARFNRIVVRGARRTTTGTFYVDTSLLAIGWSTDHETAYEAGASGVAGYAGWDMLTQAQRNAEVRSKQELSAVYSWFKIPDSWTQTIDGVPAFQDANGFLVRQDIHELYFDPIIPLYEHVDYSGTAIADGPDNPPANIYRLPLLIFKVPTDLRYICGDAISTLAESTADPEDSGDGRNWRWSAAVRVQPTSRTLEVRVSGEGQHVIAKSDFSPLAGDRDLGDFDYRSEKMLITATLVDNRCCEGKYPIDGTNDGTLVDQQYGFVIYAGDDFRQDFVVPGTVVDVSDAGLLTSSGGGYVRDDSGLLDMIARIAYEWWNQERLVLTLTTTQLTSSIQVGDLIAAIGDPAYGHYESVNTVVSELRILWPLLEANQRDTPTLQFTTGAGELDPMTMLPPRAKLLTRAAARRARQ